MTSAIAFPCHIIGLMSGTSADGVDAALLYTDGKTIAKAGPGVFVPYTDTLRQAIFGAMRGQGDIEQIAYNLTDVHIEAVEQLLQKANMQAHEVGLIGFHGQTILHAPAEQVTVQIGVPSYMANRVGIPVVANFRSNDVANGGEGAPLVPLYHAALAHSLPKPLMVVNIGGVANVTWIGEGFDSAAVISDNLPDEGEKSAAAVKILAFDCGPGNALLDDWVHQHTGARYDTNGELAARGTIDKMALALFLGDPFFAQPAPKSLDRNHFKPRVIGSVENGAATLTAMTAAAIGKACELVPERPKQLLVAGGGSHNPTMMRMVSEYAKCTAVTVASVGWDADMLEAQAFAYLAARSAQGLPLSLPSTTGVAQPVTGGVFCPVAGAGGS